MNLCYPSTFFSYKKKKYACPYYYKLTIIDGKKNIYVTEDVSTFYCYELPICKKKEKDKFLLTKKFTSSIVMKLL